MWGLPWSGLAVRGDGDSRSSRTMLAVRRVGGAPTAPAEDPALSAKKTTTGLKRHRH